MADVSLRARRTAAATALLLAVALVAAANLMPAHHTKAARLAAGGGVAIAAFVSVLVLLLGRKRPWSGSVAIAVAFALLSVTAAALTVLDSRGRLASAVTPADFLFLLFLPPLVYAARQEYRVHFSDSDRREISFDVILITASLAALAYVFLRPDGAGEAISISAAAFAVLAAAQFTMFGALALWSPDLDHVIEALLFTVLAAATVAFGWQWARGSFTATSPIVDFGFSLGTLGVAAVITFTREPPEGTKPVRLARPLLTSLSVVTASAALIFVATRNDRLGLPPIQTTIIIGGLGVAVAVRMLASQFRTAHAHDETRDALGQKQAALDEADQALDRVREANETLRQSEEHLRLVFDAAVDGIVELGHRDMILRANGAFCRMVGLDRESVEGQPWTALAAATNGADESFAKLPSTGTGTVSRSEGQPLYLESRTSNVPMDPPRRLLLVRDVTAGRVADQTIRSLFQFLQDRDEDRTRLLRRTNAAIESERNRIARDLHDGPVQGVSAASLSLEAALLMIKAGDAERGMEVLTKIRKELAEEADSLRALMSGLRPPVLEERGLIPALRDTLSRFGTDQGIHTEFDGALTKPLARDLETLAYRVVQEALSNAGKHASPRRVTVSVEADLAQLRVEIKDDGVGFDSSRTREFLHSGRVGLASMRERVELASGTFVVRSSEGRGTTIVATLPLDVALTPRELATNEV